MVSIKEKEIKGKKYIYVSTSASYKGERKDFEKYIGPKDMEDLERKKKFYSNILRMKRQLYLTYLEAKSINLKYIPNGYAYLLTLVKRQYNKFLSDLYPSELKKYKEEFEVRYVHHTTAIEGNTLSLKDASLVLAEGLSPSSKELREVHEVENYKKVLDYVEGYTGDVNLEFMKKLHELIQRNIDENTAGDLRKIPIGIRGSRWEPPPAPVLKDEISRLLDWYKEKKEELHPLELGGIFHHEFLKIHPFVDGNGRVARELLNYILMKNDYPRLIIPVEEREKYLNKLEKADEGDVEPLLEFFASLIIHDYLNVITGIIKDYSDKIKIDIKELDEEEVKEMIEVARWNTKLVDEFLDQLPEEERNVLNNI